MTHEPALIATIAIGLTAALIGALVARRLGLPSIVGYLFAGVVIGPFTPGLAANTEVALELAEIGVILLMFGVGIEFSYGDLMDVRSIAVPGGLGHTVLCAVLGFALGLAFGWTAGQALVLGLATSIASTVVLIRALMDRHELDSPQGKIAVGWLIVEDLFTVVVLVLLPSIAPLLGGTGAEEGSRQATAPFLDVAIALGKAAIFGALMVVGGRRLLPGVLEFVARQGSRELFTLAVLAGALGIAYVASAVFGVSLALGAFLAGAVIGESDVSHQAAADALPLRDAFAVLFFVSVGMLVDPAFIAANPLPIIAVLILVVVAKPVTAYVFMAAFGYPVRTSLTVSVGLGQIGEFSFIVGTVALSLGLLTVEGFQLIVAGAIVSITLNPFLFRTIAPLTEAIARRPRLAASLVRGGGELAEVRPDEREGLRGHAILAGYGRVGRMLGTALERRAFKYVVITQDRQEVERARTRGIAALYGDAANVELLTRAGIADARVVIVAMSDRQAARLIVVRARALNPRVDLVVRTHNDAEAAYLRSLGGSVQAIHGERELGVQMTRYALRRFGVSAAEAEAIAQGLRTRAVHAPAETEGRRPRPRVANVGARLRGRLAEFRSRSVDAP